MYGDQLTILARKCEEERAVAVLKDTAIRRQKGGSLPQAADWRKGGKSADSECSLVLIDRHAH